MDTKLLANPTDPSAWQQALYAFLAEKERRSGSRRTVESYAWMHQQFLDHSSLAVTTVYLRELEGVEDLSWGRVAEAIGV